MSAVFLMIREQLRVLEGKSQRESAILTSHHIKDIHYQHDSSLLILTLMLTLRSCWSGFYTVSYFCPFSYCVLWRKAPLCHMSYLLIWLLVHLIFLSISRYQYKFPLTGLNNTVIKLIEL